MLALVLAVASLALGGCAGDATDSASLDDSVASGTSAPATDLGPPAGGSSFLREGIDGEAVLHLGMSDRPGNAAALATEGVARLRYQYLAGGIGTGWTTWTPGAPFVRDYAAESADTGLVPVFSYYQLVQSVSEDVAEGDRPFRVLEDPALVRQYFEELAEFFDQAAASGAPHVILHLEPDFWGFAQQNSGDDPSTIAVDLDSLSDLVGDGLPQDLSGLAQAVLRMRDERAPNVSVAYHMSFWGSGEDPILSDASPRRVDALADRSIAFYEALDAPFDLTFTELGDRDAAFRQEIYGQDESAWWTPEDFERHRRYVQRFSSATSQDIVIWQIPYGNTQMRALDNTWNHYQDNKVEWLLDDPSGAHLQAYVDAGVVALLFGRGADGATDASDANGDGVTNPPAINGNETGSFNADDDGGFFRHVATRYYDGSPVPLPR